MESAQAPVAAPAADGGDVVEADTIEIVEESTDGETASAPIRYILERVELRGNTTRRDVIVHFIPIEPGEQFDVDDPSIEKIRWRLLGTGWFNDVKLSLNRGKEKGWAVLVVEVKERNTLVIDRVVAGLARVVTERKQHKPPSRLRASLQKGSSANSEAVRACALPRSGSAACWRA